MLLQGLYTTWELGVLGVLHTGFLNMRFRCHCALIFVQRWSLKTGGGGGGYSLSKMDPEKVMGHFGEL